MSSAFQKETGEKTRGVRRGSQMEGGEMMTENRESAQRLCGRQDLGKAPSILAPRFFAWAEKSVLPRSDSGSSSYSEEPLVL